jgi:glycosyltransferase involved in cell wall biosynthesis
VTHLLDAWRRLRLPGARLTLAGRLAEPSLVRDLPAGVRWTGALRRDRVRRLMSGSHVFAFPSLAEGSALVTYEAMAAGLPSVVTPESGSQVRDGADGFVVPRRDPAALAERLEALAEDPGLRARMGASARERIEGEYTWDHYRRRLVGAWGSALA